MSSARESSLLSAGPSSSGASSRQQHDRQGRSETTVHVPTAPSCVPCTTSTAASSAMTSSAGSASSTSSSSSASLPLQWQQQRCATYPSPSSTTVTPPITASGPSSSLPSSTMTTTSSADVGSSSLLSLASFPSSAATPPMNAPSSEPSFQDPALAKRYWNYDHPKVSLSDAVAAERAFAAAPGFVKRRLGSGCREQPPWFWAQNSATYFTVIKSEDVGEEEVSSVCAVCLEEYEEFHPCYILLRCFHFFHCFCLLEWWIQCVSEGKEMTCPLCRSMVPYPLFSQPRHEDAA